MRSISRVQGQSRREGRARFASASLIAGATLVAGLLSAPAASAAPGDDSIDIPDLSSVVADQTKYPAGTYIVTLKDAPAASYTGGVAGFDATKPVTGRQLNAKSDPVKKYTKHLAAEQKSLASAVGVDPLYNYTLAYNGFAAELSSLEATRLAKSDSVLAVTPNEILHIQEAQTSTDYLKISTPGGVWDSIGGVGNAGKGVVVGVLDTGIAPENPSFAGAALGTAASTNKPWLDGNTVKFTKSDGTTFSSTRVTGEQFTLDDYSTKIIGAHYYLDGFGADNIGDASLGEYVSPRDGDSHGSHTASTAAGNSGVPATVVGEDFGDISGVAPAAKISAYKVCWSGEDPDPDVTTDDGCANTDIVAAIEQAVADGVDVINFSIGGGAATTVYSPTDRAFLNAASAGIFVSASAGNSGPAASTLDNAAPWETTVAASTIPSYEATVKLGNGELYAGASITVDRDPGATPLSGPLVLASAIPASGKSADDANLCLAGSIDPAAAAGKIVVCERGNNARVAKSATVAAAGGIGMILLNVDPGDTITDEHSVPTVHLDAPYRDAVRAYAATAGATATFYPDNTTGTATPVPQLAGFSSRGPVEAAGSDVLKPDVAAPGVSILAAGANAEGEAPTYEFLSGTSMAAPHVAGLAALYFGVHPLASPAEVNSALSTTATNTVNNDNEPTPDPFGQGAGQVNPSKFLNPGLLYLNGVADWKRYLVGAGEATFEGVSAIDPSNLNLPSIAIGDLAGTQKVTRSVTSQAAGTYKASIKVPGLTTKVSPSTLKFTAAGQTKSFTVTFTRTTAPLDKWTTGFLTWKKSGSTSVRSPIAIHPTAVQVPDVVRGEGTSGTATVEVIPGAKATIPIETSGLAQGFVSENQDDPSLPYSGLATTGESAQFVHVVEEGTSFARFDVRPVEENIANDFDLYIFYAEDEDAEPELIAQSASGSAIETVDLDDPAAGIYIAYVDYFSATPEGAPYTETFWALNPATDVGNFTAIPSEIKGKTGVETSFDLRWGGLAPHTSFLGFVHYGDADAVTDVYVETGDALPPVSVEPPTIEGDVAAGATVSVNVGEWDAETSALQFSYQWLSDGEAIDGATGEEFVIPAGLVGTDLSVLVTARIGDDGPETDVASDPVTVKASSVTKLTLPKPTVTTKERAQVVVAVTTAPAGHAVGEVTVKYNKKTVSAELKAANNGTVTVSLPKLKKGTYTITAIFEGGDEAGSSVSATKKLTVK